MKMKILLVLIFFSIIIFISYIHTTKEEINYTIMGDDDIFSNSIISKNFSDLIYEDLKKIKNFGFYSKEFTYKDIRIIDLINKIESNEEKEQVSIQNILKNTNILLLNIGSNEINYKLFRLEDNENIDNTIYNYLDQLCLDLEKIVKIVNKYNEGKVIFLGYFNNTDNIDNNKYFEYMNNKVKEIMKDNNILFIDLYNILNKNEDYLTKSSKTYITNRGNMAIYDKIYSKIDDLYLHKKN